MRLLLAFAILASASPAFAEGATADADRGAQAAGWMADFDKLWHERSDPKAVKKLYDIVEPVQKKNDTDFEANWRLSALLNWDANNYPDGDLKAGLGKRAWTVGDKAIQGRPDDVRGQYNAAIGIGLYSEGVGILTALSQGLEGKFKSRAQAALRIDKDYLEGAPQVLWGRFFMKLPWPKKDLDQSIKVLTSVVKDHPENLRAKYFLADSLLDDGKKAEAKKLGAEVMAAPHGKDLAEDKKVRSETERWLKAHQGDF